MNGKMIETHLHTQSRENLFTTARPISKKTPPLRICYSAATKWHSIGDRVVRYLMLSINTTATDQLRSKKERKLVLHSVAKSPASLDVVLDFMIDHKDEIKKAFSRTGRKYNWRKVTQILAPQITSDAQMIKLERLLLKTRSSDNMHQVISTARWAIQWRQNNTRTIKHWLKDSFS